MEDKSWETQLQLGAKADLDQFFGWLKDNCDKFDKITLSARLGILASRQKEIEPTDAIVDLLIQSYFYGWFGAWGKIIAELEKVSVDMTAFRIDSDDPEGFRKMIGIPIEDWQALQQGKEG